MTAYFGVRYDSYGSPDGAVRFANMKFFRHGPEHETDLVRYFVDASGVRWWVRRDVEQALGIADEYQLARMCNPGNRWLVRVHAAVGDLNAKRVIGMRCLLRSEDLIGLLRRLNSFMSLRLADRIEKSISRKERDPAPPDHCEHCGHEIIGVAAVGRPRRKKGARA